MRAFCKEMLKDYPDVMTTLQVAKFTGHCKNSVAKRCNKKELRNLFIKQRFLIPREYLLDFLVSKYFIGISVKAKNHKKFNREIRNLRPDN